MKDQRFIELLNLYIDRQISTAETAELEAEIQQDPKRQKVYRQYCKIHTATKVVYGSFRAGAEQPAGVATDRPATIELFESRRRRSHWAYYAGGLAAAACLAVVFMRQSPSSATAPENLAAAPQAGASVIAASPAPVVPAPAAVAPEATPAAPAVRSATPSPDYSAMLTAMREQDEERALATAARVQSLFNDDLFEAQRGPVGTDLRTVRPRQANSQAEFTGFQFQR